MASPAQDRTPVQDKDQEPVTKSPPLARTPSGEGGNPRRSIQTV